MLSMRSARSSLITSFDVPGASSNPKRWALGWDMSEGLVPESTPCRSLYLDLPNGESGAL